MQVTSLGHSGFLVEWEDIACLFDWSEGELPSVAPDRNLYVFASHAHGDHYREEVFSLADRHGKAVYVLSSDIPVHPAESGSVRSVRLGPGAKRRFAGGRHGVMSVFTLGSTDEGVAFLVNYAGKTVYHAGDLHWWAWPDDSPEEARSMKERFFREIAVLKGLKLDAAFLPPDSRLEENYWLGFDALMRTANVQNAFPMHMWRDYSVVDALNRREDSAPYRERIRPVGWAGQIFEL